MAHKTILKVLIATPLYPPDIGGPATYSKLLFEKLPDYDIAVSVISFGAVRQYPKIVRHIAYFFLVYRAARHVDAVYAQDPVSVGLPAFFAARCASKKFLLKVVGDYAWEQGVQRFSVSDTLDVFSRTVRGYGLSVRILKYIQTCVARHADRIVVPSNYLKGILSNWTIPKEKIHVIYNAFLPITLAEDRPTLRQSLGIDTPTIVSVGRLVPWKGFDTLIRLMPQILRDVPNTNLIIIGDGPDRERLMNMVSELDLKESVVFLGSTKQELVYRYLAAADAFVLNTSYEGFSHVLLEAMSLGVPVLTTSAGGNIEIVENEQNGLLVSPNDTALLHAGIVRLLTDSPYGKRLSHAAHSKVAEFSEERMLSQLVQVLHE